MFGFRLLLICCTRRCCCCSAIKRTIALFLGLGIQVEEYNSEVHIYIGSSFRVAIEKFFLKNCIASYLRGRFMQFASKPTTKERPGCFLDWSIPRITSLSCNKNIRFWTVLYAFFLTNCVSLQSH